MASSNPVRYSAQVETVEADEQDIVSTLNHTFDAILQKTRTDYGHAVRAVHAKAHGILAGTFTIREGLAPELAQGLFSVPGEHKAIVRLSTNAGDILDDSIALPRGLALKIFDVDGERLTHAEGRTQDFVMINSPIFTVPTAKKFAGNLKMLAKTTDRAESAKIALSKVLQAINGALGSMGSPSTTLASLGGAPQVEPLGETYFSVTPFRYGEYIAKFRLRPLSEALTALTGAKIDTHGHPDAIREAVQEQMIRIDAEWAFEVQLCRDLERQPIEDATQEWKEDEAPFEAVATLRVPAQQSWDAQRVSEVEDRTRFSVWTGLAAHLPLGQINRARRDTYVHSAMFRAEANGCPMHEPRG